MTGLIVLLSAGPAISQTETGSALEQVVITASAFPEARERITGTVQVIDQASFDNTQANSIANIFAQNAGGFLTEFNEDQTQINIRGGASDGQGRDFLSDVLVLVNGRRAGTANISKFSLDDVDRVEIVRGPASVIYGSQNIGGVINIILKNGLNVNGGTADVTGGSWGLWQGHVEDGGIVRDLDWYFSMHGGERQDYHSGEGGGEELNTAWTRAGATGGVGFAFNNDNRVDFDIRSDGIYNAGFRGGQRNVYNRDNRYNQSFDLSWLGHTPDGMFTWSSHAYGVIDTDMFRWESPVIVSNNKPAPGTSLDDNRRVEDILGNQLRGQAELFEGNSLLLGWDFEASRLRSERRRLGLNGVAISQVPPYDSNQHEYVNGLYTEDTQSLLDDRLTLRGGARWTMGRVYADPTPNLNGVILRSEPYDALTWSAGASFKVEDWWVARIGASSGFRAPDATQLAGDFTAIGGGKTFGNPNLRPETSNQLELGSAFAPAGNIWYADIALFQNTITHRFTTQQIAANTQQYINSGADLVVDGLDAQLNANILAALGAQPGAWNWTVFSTGSYNFSMVDNGALPGSTTNTATRIYRYEGSFGTRIGQSGVLFHGWSATFTALLRGPMWNAPASDPEYILNSPGEFSNTYIIRKNPYWVFNFQGSLDLTDSLELLFFVNNIFNKNEDPIFFVLDEPNSKYQYDTRFLDGPQSGNSMPGRNFAVTLRARF